MGLSMTSASHPPRRPVMAFIDGGHLRSGVTQILGMDENKINFQRLGDLIHQAGTFGGIIANVRRMYYYDAIVAKEDDEGRYEAQSALFDKIERVNLYEVRLGRLIPNAKTKAGNERPKQKGVDVLMAIDMLTKAYRDQFEVAVFLGGDDDFLDLIKAVKDSGKNVVGMYFPEKTSDRMVKCFDMRVELNKASFEKHGLFRQD